MTQVFEISSRILRIFSTSWSIMLALLAFFLKKSHPESIVWSLPLIFSVICLTGLAFPAVMQGPYRVVERLLRPIGELFSLLLLALIYFGIFTLCAALLRVAGRDTLERQRRKWQGSAWKIRQQRTNADDYYWQY